jgi:hypothetical protein
VLERLGGRTRARTWDPMIKSHLQRSQEHESLAILVQPTLNQHYAATEREQTCVSVALFIIVFRIFRLALPAHNGLVAGSSPAGPTNEVKGLWPAPDILKTRRRERIE